MSIARSFYSLRRRLVALLVGVLVVLWGGSALLAFRTAHAEADELFDAQLVQVAETLLAIVAASESPGLADEMAEHQHAYQLPVAFQAWQADEAGNWRLMLHSSEMPTDPVSANPGFDEHLMNGELWRFYTVDHVHSGYRVVVGQNHAARYRLAGTTAVHLIVPLVLGLPLMAFGVWAVVGRALRPVNAAAKAVGGMDARRLTPVPLTGPLPEEIAPLVRSIDALVVRVNEALDNERRFTADAAHELRTPLAAIKLQAQVAARAGDTETCARALAQVASGVDRMTHLVEQLLTLARLDPDAPSEATERVDVVAVAEQVCSLLVPQASRRNQQLSIEAPAGFPLIGNRWWLEVLVRNLVDNALRYSAVGGQVTVTIDAAERTLRVADDGPGIAPAARARMLTRFARGSGTEEEGCGLGLSIVARLVAIMGAVLELEDGLPREGGVGLAVRVTFPEV